MTSNQELCGNCEINKEKIADLKSAIEEYNKNGI